MAFDPRTHVIGWEADQDGSCFYRISEPIRNLPPHQWIGESSETLPRKWMHADVVHAQRVSKNDEEAQPVLGWIDVCRDSDVLSIYDVDDNYFAVPEHNPAHSWYSQPAVQNNIKACAIASDIVTTSTEILGDVMRKLNPNTVVIPNYIDNSVLRIPRPAERDKVVVGWAGSATHDADFVGVKPQLFNMLFSHPDVVFAAIGGDYASDLPRDRVRRFPWTRSTKRVYKSIAQFDIGIAPLAKDDFNDSKSYIKALEYAALGIPIIASRQPAYEDFVIHEETGILVDSPAEWGDALDLLIKDRNLRETLGGNARELARDYTLQANIHKFERLYSQ